MNSVLVDPIATVDKFDKPQADPPYAGRIFTVCEVQVVVVLHFCTGDDLIDAETVCRRLHTLLHRQVAGQRLETAAAAATPPPCA